MNVTLSLVHPINAFSWCYFFIDSEPLYQVKLLAALRNGDATTIQQFLSGLSYGHGLGGQLAARKGSMDSANTSELDLAATALHLAIRVAPGTCFGFVL